VTPTTHYRQHLTSCRAIVLLQADRCLWRFGRTQNTATTNNNNNNNNKTTIYKAQ